MFSIVDCIAFNPLKKCSTAAVAAMFYEPHPYFVCSESPLVGSPIPVPKRVSPSQEEVDHYHGLYMEALAKLFHEHKTSCGLSDTHELRII